MVEYLAYLAAFCTTFAFVPQALLIWRTKNTASISLGMYSIFTSGVGFWFIYGVITAQPPLIAANAVTFLLAFGILCMKLANFKKDKKVS